MLKKNAEIDSVLASQTVEVSLGELKSYVPGSVNLYFEIIWTKKTRFSDVIRTLNNVALLKKDLSDFIRLVDEHPCQGRIKVRKNEYSAHHLNIWMILESYI